MDKIPAIPAFRRKDALLDGGMLQRFEAHTAPIAAASGHEHAAGSSSVDPDSVNTTLALIRQLTPQSKQMVLQTLLAEGIQTSPESTFKQFTLASESEDSLFNYWHTVDAPPALCTLLTTGFHLPLSLCTHKALDKMNDDTSSMTWLKVPDARGVDTTILDVSTWPAEADMDIESWHIAWLNYPLILARVCSAEIVARFEAHRNWLRGKSPDEFPAVLAFDTKIRRVYFRTKNTFTVGSTEYTRGYQEIAIGLMYQTLLGNAGRTVELHPARSNRFQPYDMAARSMDNAPASDMDLCLICGESGHHARLCDRPTLANGRSTYSTWSNGMLRTVGNPPQELCVAWNRRGRCHVNRCTGQERHVCSFCGSDEHHARSMRCM